MSDNVHLNKELRKRGIVRVEIERAGSPVYMSKPPQPFFFLSSEVKEHHPQRDFRFNQQAVKLIVTSDEELPVEKHMELAYEKGLRNPANVNLLFFLLKHTELIPRNWNKYLLLFAGSIYQLDGFEYVPTLVFRRESEGYYPDRTGWGCSASWGSWGGERCKLNGREGVAFVELTS